MTATIADQTTITLWALDHGFRPENERGWLARGPVRIAFDDTDINVYRFTDPRMFAVKWSANFRHAPVAVVAATITTGLDEWLAGMLPTELCTQERTP